MCFCINNGETTIEDCEFYAKQTDNFPFATCISMGGDGYSHKALVTLKNCKFIADENVTGGITEGSIAPIIIDRANEFDVHIDKCTYGGNFTSLYSAPAENQSKANVWVDGVQVVTAQ